MFDFYAHRLGDKGKSVNDPHRKLKDAFGRYATGVTVATCRAADGALAALTVNSFTSVSLDPALVLWSIEKSASCFDIFDRADNYGISILKADQENVSTAFAMRGAQALEDIETTAWKTGAPILVPRLAGFDCRIVDRRAAGDHVVLVGEVVEYDVQNGAPLIYFASQYGVGPQA